MATNRNPGNRDNLRAGSQNAGELAAPKRTNLEVAEEHGANGYVNAYKPQAVASAQQNQPDRKVHGE